MRFFPPFLVLATFYLPSVRAEILEHIQTQYAQ